jgi:hypothetical protein
MPKRKLSMRQVNEVARLKAAKLSNRQIARSCKIARSNIEDAAANGRLASALPLSPTERMTYRTLLRSLSPGEASCIVCARERGGIVVTDDRAARTACTEFGIAFTGTIGILKACCQQGALDPHTADAVLHTMIAAGYRSPVGRITDIL